MDDFQCLLSGWLWLSLYSPKLVSMVYHCWPIFSVGFVFCATHTSWIFPLNQNITLLSVSFVERPDLKSLSTFSQCTEFPSHRRFGTAHGLGLVEKYCLLWRQVSDSARDVPSCERYAARQTAMITWSRQPLLRHHVGVTCRKTWPKGLSSFSQCTEFLPHWGFKLMSSRSRVRRSN